MEKPSKNAIYVWRIWYTAIACGEMFIAGGFFVFSFSLGLVTVVLVVLLYIALMLWYAPMLYKSYEYSIGSTVFVKKGVIFKKQINLDSSKIQYLETSSSLIQRFFSVSDLKIYTSGSHLIIRNIEREKAENYVKRAGVK